MIYSAASKVFTSLLVVSLNLFLVSAIPNSYPTSNTCIVDNSLKTACNSAAYQSAVALGETGDVSITYADACLAAGCCWMKSLHTPQVDSNTDNHPLNCYESVPNTLYLGYELKQVKQAASGLTGTLETIGPGGTTFGPDISKLSLSVVYHSDNIVEVKITDANNARWEIPESLIPFHSPEPVRSKTFDIKYSSNPFTLQVIRKADQEVIFDLDSNFIFKDQYLEFSIRSNNKEDRKTYGLGESTKLKQALDLNHLYTLWAADMLPSVRHHNLYGSYPLYLQQLTNPSKSPNNVGNVHGGLFYNSNGMDVLLRDDRITFKAIGGVFDFFVFSGPTAKEVISQSASIIGKASMPPYWSLGFHNCRWGYNNIQEVQEVVANYSAAKIPLDTQWLDIDYMDEYRDFTVSPTSFPLEQVQSFVSKLHNNGQRFVPILDPGIMIYPGYQAYQSGLEAGIFIKDLTGENYYIGQVWPGSTHFPDFLHPKAQDYWTTQLQGFYDMVQNDGIWIDMNEVSNFCNLDGTGQICEIANTRSKEGKDDDCIRNCCLSCHTVDATNPLDFPQYHINNIYGHLSTRTLAMSNLHYGNISVYNTHNLYGLSEQIATNRAMTQIRGKRAFVLSRSSFLSTGVHSAKWTGDNSAHWNDLKSSIISMLDFNIYSVPMIGSDICGFNGDSNEELCARWIELGAFYPFSRDHNTHKAAPQELYRWETVTAAAKSALGMRYQLLPFLYNLFYEAHQAGTPVVTSLWMNFPTDPVVQDEEKAVSNKQFMWGEALLISPVLDAKHRRLNAYFPKAFWYSFQTLMLEVDATSSEGNSGVWQELPMELTEVGVHVRGGSILPLHTQPVGGEQVLTTVQARATPLTLLAALSESGEANGELFWDDGEELNGGDTSAHYIKTQMQASAAKRTFSATLTHNSLSTNEVVPTIGTIKLMAKVDDLDRPLVVTCNGHPVDRTNWTFEHVANLRTGVKSARLTVSINLPLDTKEIQIKW